MAGRIVASVALIIALAVGGVSTSGAPQRAVATPGATATAATRVPWAGLYENLDFCPDIPNDTVLPWKVGAHNLFHWSALEPADQSFNWGNVATWVNNVDRYGYLANIGVIFLAQPAGALEPNDQVFLPSWMLTEGNHQVYYLRCNGHRVPYYWNQAFIDQYRQLINSLAYFLKNNSAGQKVDLVTIAIANYAELDPSQAADWECLRLVLQADDLAGKSGIANIWNRIRGSSYRAGAYSNLSSNDGQMSYYEAGQFWGDLASYYAWAYQEGWRSQSVSVPMYASVADNAWHSGSRQRFADYLAAQGLGFSHNKVQADEEYWLDERHNTGQYDPFLDYQEQVSTYGEIIDSFNEPVHTAPTEWTLTEQIYWSLANAIDKHMDKLNVNFFIWPDNPVERNYQFRIPLDHPQISAMLRDFVNLAGYHAPNAPYVMSIMRETQNVRGYYPQCGNFDFYLYATVCPDSVNRAQMTGQCSVPSVPAGFDGCAKPVWNVLGKRNNTTYAKHCNGARGQYLPNCDPRWRMARVTDGQNPRIYFDVDDLYAFGAQSTAQVTVQYVDLGTDAIAVEYFNTNGQRVQVAKNKGNTGEWVEWTFVLTNMAADNRFPSGADFTVYDNGDGVEYVHLVKFVRANAATPTPTRGPTATFTPGPTPTSCWAPSGATPTPTATPNPYGGSYLASRDTYINSEAPTATYPTALLQLRASTQGTPQPTAYHTVRQSGLVEVSLALPTQAVVQGAQLELKVAGFSGDTLYVFPRSVSTVNDASSWQYAAPGTPWQTPGAYGPGDVGARGTPMPISTREVGQSVLFNVTGMVSHANARIKLEPVCTPVPGTGCTGSVTFYSAESRGLEPVLHVNATAAPTPTATATATPTATPMPTATPTSTAASTATPSTRTPTPAATLWAQPGRVLKINEVCPYPVNTDNWPDGVVNAGDAAVEIVNLLDQPVDLSAYVLMAGVERRLRGVIPPRGYKVYYAAADGIRLEAGSGSVVLYYTGTTPWAVVDSMSYQNTVPDGCWARDTDGNPIWRQRTQPSLGKGN